MCKNNIWILTAILLGTPMTAAASENASNHAVILEQEEDTLEAPDASEEEVLYQVSFPTDIHGFLDPGNLSGKGQIFSERYAVENYGNTDIKIKIKNIDVYYASSEDVYEFSDEKIEDHSSGVKRMNIQMVWENESEGTKKALCLSEGVRDEEVLELKAPEHDENGAFVSLKEGSFGLFYFTGTLNANPNIEWEEGELIIRFDYEILSTGHPEEQKDEALNAGDNEKEEGSINQADAEDAVSPKTAEGETADQMPDKENSPAGTEEEGGTDVPDLPGDENVKKDPEIPDETAGTETTNPEDNTSPAGETDPENETQQSEQTNPEEEKPKPGETAPEEERPNPEEATPEEERPNPEETVPEEERPKPGETTPEEERPNPEETVPEEEKSHPGETALEEERPLPEEKEEAKPEPETGLSGAQRG